jgi:hypothetical protein
MSDEQIRAILNQTKQYVAAKEYDKARELLLQIDHPKRDQWLERLEQSKRQQKMNSRPKPWNPGWISTMSFVMTPIVSSLLLAWNWRRFDKKEWVLPTILGYIAILALLIASFFAVFKTVAQSGTLDMGQRFFVVGIMVLLGMANVLYPFYIGGQQGGAYKLIEQKGFDAGRSYQYRWGRGTIFYVAEILVFGLGTLFYVWYQNQPQTFDDGRIQVTYPGNWETIELNEIQQCNTSTYMQCRFAIQKGSYSSIAIVGALLDTSNTAPGTASDVGKFFWQSLSEDPNFEPLTHDSYQFAGLDGYYVTYLNNSYYVTDIFVVDGVDILYISISSSSEEATQESWGQIEGILNSIQLQ